MKVVTSYPGVVDKARLSTSWDAQLGRGGRRMLGASTSGGVDASSAARKATQGRVLDQTSTLGLRGSVILAVTLPYRSRCRCRSMCCCSYRCHYFNTKSHALDAVGFDNTSASSNASCLLCHENSAEYRILRPRQSCRVAGLARC